MIYILIIKSEKIKEKLISSKEVKKYLNLLIKIQQKGKLIHFALMTIMRRGINMIKNLHVVNLCSLTQKIKI